jgi:hypothetical protein
VSSTFINLAGTATDNGSGGSGISSVTVNGGSASQGTASGNNTANWIRGINLSPGSNVVTVVATDGAGNARTVPITLIAPTPIPVMTGASVSANLSSPRTTGTTVTFTGGGTGGQGPYSFKWWVQKDGGSWVMQQDWGTGTYSWTPSQTGNYVIGAWGRSSGATADVAQAVGTFSFQVTAPAQAPAPQPPAPQPPAPAPQMTSVSLSPSLSSPRATGTTVTFTATGTGGTAPYSFKWWIQKDGGAWTMQQDWNGGTLNWTPSQTGTYVIGAWGRSAGATADVAQAIGTTAFVITSVPSAPPPPPAPAPPPAGSSMSSVTVSTNLPSPQMTGTPLTFTASGSGGVAPYSYKWWMQKDGGAWTLVRDWSTNSLTWTPNQPGTYVIGAWGRSSGSTTNVAQAIGTATVIIGGVNTPGAPMTGASVAVTSSGMLQVGSSMTLTASGSGGSAPYSFKWWVQRNGGEWLLLQSWGSSTFTWTPPLPGTYVFGVWGRSSGATADLAQAIGTTTAVVYP